MHTTIINQLKSDKWCSKYKTYKQFLDSPFWQINKYLLKLKSRTIALKAPEFSNFVEEIITCLFFLSFDYVCSNISEGVQKVRILKQAELIPKTNLFS